MLVDTLIESQTKPVTSSFILSENGILTKHTGTNWKSIAFLMVTS